MNAPMARNRPLRSGLAVFLAVVALAAAAGAATPAEPKVGSWATYQWTSTARAEVPVLIRQDVPGGQATWSVARETTTPPPLYVTYAIVRSDAPTYTMQIVTHETPDGPPLSVTQVQVNRKTGKAVRSVIKRPKGTIPTPEDGLRPFRQSAVKGTAEPVAVPSGRVTAVRASYQDGTVWVSDEVPALGLVKATFPSGTLELVRSGSSAAKDLLRS
jgi:hypothetical protein